MGTDQAADPHVSRTIRTPHATISIRGTLEEVDNIYRVTNRALLDSGRYTIPKPSNDWANFGAPAEVSTDHLLRRIVQLESIIAESENHATIQAMRASFKQIESERNQWKVAFTDISEMAALALDALNDSTLPDSLARIVARGQLA